MSSGKGGLRVRFFATSSGREPVREWLASQPKARGFVNIVADAHVPFGAVRRVIATAQDVGYANVNLAVQPKP